MLGARHPDLVELRRLLGRRSARVEAGRYVAEGPTVVVEALAAGAPVRRIYLGVDADEGDRARILDAARVTSPAVDVVEVRAGVLARVLDAVTPRPVAAVIDRRITDPAVVMAGPMDRPVVVMAGLADPGNVGTVLRSALAAGAAGALTTPGTADVFGPKVVRAAAGALFRLPVAVDVELAVAVAAAHDAGRQVIAAVPAGGEGHRGLRWPPGAVVVVGNEARGLTPAELSLVDRRVTIEMDGPAESLNVAMAATLLLFDAVRDR